MVVGEKKYAPVVLLTGWAVNEGWKGECYVTSSSTRRSGRVNHANEEGSDEPVEILWELRTEFGEGVIVRVKTQYGVKVG